MDAFQIIVDLGSLELAHGVITGKIHVSNTTFSFPEAEWNDFVVVILGWWVAAAAQVLDGTKPRDSLQFMDGPYSIEISHCSGGNVTLTLQASARRRTVETWTCDPGAIHRELIRSAGAVLATCETKGWRTADTTTLASNLRLLKHVKIRESR